MLSMRQSYRIIPIYTADVSGVCSALYELGGMTVMHDPSGCNSTYNTHDEIRWYDQDSLIFISGLTEIDAIMGNDRKFIDDIEHAARELHPKFIALAGSPIPFMNGTDFPAIARVIETETGILTFAVPTNGMHDYVYGAGIALEEIAKRFTKKADTEHTTQNQKSADKVVETEMADDNNLSDRGSFSKKAQNLNLQEQGIRFGRSVNLLGVTPLDFGSQKNVELLKENLHKYGWNVLSTWAMGDTLETLQIAGNADVNLVVSAVGLRAANALQEKFGTPYVIGTPNEWLAEDISEALEQVVQQQNAFLSEHTCENLSNPSGYEDKASDDSRIAENRKKPDRNSEETKERETDSIIVYLNNRMQKAAEITLIGEPVTMGSLAAGIEKTYGRSVRVFCPLKECEDLIGEKDDIVLGEEAMEEALKDAKIIVADPLYKPICSKESEFYELPHVAFSGRIYIK